MSPSVVVGRAPDTKRLVAVTVELSPRAAEKMRRDAASRGLTTAVFARLLLEAAWAARWAPTGDAALDAAVARVLAGGSVFGAGTAGAGEAVALAGEVETARAARSTAETHAAKAEAERDAADQDRADPDVREQRLPSGRRSARRRQFPAPPGNDAAGAAAGRIPVRGGRSMTHPVAGAACRRGTAIASAWATIAGLALDHGPLAEIYRIRRDARVTAGLVPGAAEPEARLLADALLLWERAAAAAATDPAAALRAGRLRALVLQATDLVLAVAAGGRDGGVVR